MLGRGATCLCANGRACLNATNAKSTCVLTKTLTALLHFTNKHMLAVSVLQGVKFCWANLQSLFLDCKGQILVIFQELGKSGTELGNCSILGHRLDCEKNGFADHIMSKDLPSL